MADGPAQKFPLGGSSGDARQDLRAVRAEIASIQKEIEKTAKAGAKVDKEQLARLKKAQDIQRTIKSGIDSKESIERFEKSAKRYKSLFENASLRNVLSGNANFSDVANVLDNKKVEAIAEKVLGKMGAGNFAAPFFRALPIASLAAEVVSGEFNDWIQMYEKEAAINKHRTANYTNARRLGIDPVLSKKIRDEEAQKRVQERGFWDKAARGLNDSSASWMLGAGGKYLLEKYAAGSANEENQKLEENLAKRQKDIVAVRQNYAELMGIKPEELFSDYMNTSEAARNSVLDNAASKFLDSKEGQNKLKRLVADREVAELQKQEDERRKTPAQKMQEARDKKSADFLSQARNQRYASSLIMVTHISD